MLTAVAGIILGMGMPTTPAYIVMVSLMVPAIMKLGVIEPAAHMFAFYFAILSAITPPVALAVYAAASLAKADLWKSGWAAVKIGAAGFIVPFMFVFQPALLMIGDWPEIIHATISACIGIAMLAGGLHGFFRFHLRVYERAMLIAGALAMTLVPGWIGDATGIVLLALVLVGQRLMPNRAAQMS